MVIWILWLGCWLGCSEMWAVKQTQPRIVYLQARVGCGNSDPSSVKVSSQHKQLMRWKNKSLFTYRPSPRCWHQCCHPPPRPWSPAWSGRGPPTCWSLGRGCFPQTVGPDSWGRWSSSCRGKKSWSETLLNNAGVLSMKHKWLSLRRFPQE